MVAMFSHNSNSAGIRGKLGQAILLPSLVHTFYVLILVLSVKISELPIWTHAAEYSQFLLFDVVCYRHSQRSISDDGHD